MVDGLALRQRWRTGVANARWDVTTIPFGDAATGLPALGTAEQKAIDLELRALDDAVDALGDLLLAEGVHQIVHGNPARAGASVDALSRGDAPPPDVDVVRTPRAGTGVTHRLLVLIDPSSHAEGWPTDATQVRAAVEPALEAWVARVLGPASRVRARARYTWPEGDATAETDISVLRLSALDVVAMAPAGDPDGASELEQRLIEHFARKRPERVPATASVVLDSARDPAWTAEVIDLADLSELARSVRALLDGARPVEPRDLTLPGDAAPATVDAADLAARAGIAVAALQRARATLAAAIEAATSADEGLRQASQLGVARGAPAAVLAELDRRLGAVTDAEDDRARVVAALGNGFHLLPRLSLPADVAASFAASVALQGGDAMASVTWLQRAAHVREGASRLEQALLCAEAAGSPEALSLHVASAAAHRERPLGRAARTGRWRSSVDRRAGVAGCSCGGAGRGARRRRVDGSDPGADAGDRRELSRRSAELARAAGDPPRGAADRGARVEPRRARGHRAGDARARAPAPRGSRGALSADGASTMGTGAGSLVIPRPGHFLPATYLAAAPSDRTVTTDLGRVAAPERPA